MCVSFFKYATIQTHVMMRALGCICLEEMFPAVVREDEEVPYITRWYGLQYHHGVYAGLYTKEGQ